MKTSIILLRIAGIINILFLVFHLAFAKLFNWNQELSCLSQLNYSIMLTYHYIVILVLSFMALIPLFQTKALLSSSLKYGVLTMFCLFYIIRIIAEFTLFGITDHSSVIFILCALPVVCFVYPMVKSPNQ